MKFVFTALLFIASATILARAEPDHDVLLANETEALDPDTDLDFDDDSGLDEVRVSYL